MAATARASSNHEFGCGGMTGFFYRRFAWLRKTPVHSLPSESNNGMKLQGSCDNLKKAAVDDSQRRVRNKSEFLVFESSESAGGSSKQERRLSLLPARPNEGRRSLSSIKEMRTLAADDSKPRRNSVGDPKELNIVVHRQQPSDHKELLQASSGNVPLKGQLGNLKQLGGSNSHRTSINLQDLNSTPRVRNSVMGNIVRQPSSELRCQDMSNRKDPEVLKNMGNDKYKQGRFEEALMFYDQAIALDSSNATYRSNKSAALIGLGRLMDAVSECREAIRLHPSYQRAHLRLATLYVRLGEAEKALHHYKQSGTNANLQDVAKAQELLNHLNRCIEARRLSEWNILLKETDHAILSGADSAPKVFAMQAEALLRLRRHQEAYTAFNRKGLKLCVASCIKLFGPVAPSYLFMIEAQVYIAAGRFEDAVAAAQQAAQLDPCNKEVSVVLKQAKVVASARLSGNLLFKASKFSEASVVYSEGLEYDPENAILLCNRATCRFKLGQFEKAVEDCTAALKAKPNYRKARLRRADCNANLQRWEASIEDYEMLIRESPADEEVGRALFDAQVQLKKEHGEDTKDLKFGSNLVFISSNERFRHFVTSPGMSVVLFCKKSNHKQILELMEQVCKRFPSVNFLKVEIEDHPYLTKSEGVKSLPCFKIYRNGSRVKEIPSNNQELLEQTVKLYSS